MAPKPITQQAAVAQQQSKRPDDSGKKSTSRIQSSQVSWEAEMMQVCGKTITIKHPHLDPGTVTTDYNLSNPRIQLQDGITMNLNGSNGQVSVSASGQDIIFTVMGGSVDFRPKNLKSRKGTAELATTNIVASDSAVPTTALPTAQEGQPDVFAANIALTPDDTTVKSTSKATPADPSNVLHTEVSAYLKTPLVISPRKDFKLELGQGEFVKRGDDQNPKIKFWDTKLTYKDTPITASFETESDQAGLHLSGNSRVWLDNTNVKGMKKLPADITDESHVVIDDAGFRLEYDPDAKAADIAAAEEAERKAAAEKAAAEKAVAEKLAAEKAAAERAAAEKAAAERAAAEKAAAEEAEQKAATAKRMGPRVLTLGSVTLNCYDMTFDGNDHIVTAKKVTGICNGQKIVLSQVRVANNSELAGLVESISPLSGAKFSIECTRLEIDSTGTPRTHKASLKDDFLTYELEDVSFLPGEVIAADAAHCPVSGYDTTFYDVTYKGAGYMDYGSADLDTEIDYGRNLDEEEKKAKKEAKKRRKAARTAARAAKKGKTPPQDTAAASAKIPAVEDGSFFTFKLDKGILLKGKFQQGISSLNIASHQKVTEIEVNKEEKTKEKTSGTKIDKDIFTKDGFAQLENATFQFKTDENKEGSISGKGQFTFQSIPYHIVLSDGSVLIGDTQQKDDPEEDAAEFTIDQSGALNAEVGDGVELSLPSAQNGSESIIYSVVLDGVTVEGGYLKAKALRVYEGAEVETDVEDYTENSTLRTLFGMGLKVSSAHLSNKPPKLGPDGITSDTSNEKQKAHAGRFGVSGFLGYLSADVDYPAGQIHAELAHEEEKDDLKFSKIYDKKGNTLFNPDLEVPIIPGLNFTFGAKPEVSYGGALSADVDRHKSFGEKLEVGESLELKGSFELSGTAGVSISIGLSAGVAKIFSVGAELSANASATMGADMAAKIAFAKQDDGKFAQSEDLELSGGINAALNLALTFACPVRLLVWKANIYEYTIAEKEIKLNPLSFTLKKAKNSGGLLSGWNVEEISLSADAFGKQAQLAFSKAVKEDPYHEVKGQLAVSKEAVAVLGDAANDTWKALEDMKAHRDHGYIIEPDDKAALEASIQSLTGTCTRKLEEYRQSLIEHHQLLTKARDFAKQEFVSASKKLENSAENSLIWSTMSSVAEKGGFKGIDAYKTTDTQNLKGADKRAAQKGNKETGDSALADLKIATILGNHDLAFSDAKAELAKRVEEYNKGITNDQFKYQLPDLSKVSEKEFHTMGFLRGENKFTGLQLLQELSTIRGSHNYYDVLRRPVLDGLDKMGANLVRKEFGDLYRKVFRKKSKPDDAADKGTYLDTKMTGYEFLKCVLTDKYPENAANDKGQLRAGQSIGGTAEQKNAAVDALFHNINDDMYAMTSGGLSVQINDTSSEDTVYNDFARLTKRLFGFTPQEASSSGKFDLNKAVETLKENVKTAEENYKTAQEAYRNADKEVRTCNAQIKECKDKLKKLNEDVSAGAQVDQPGAAVKAAAAVDYIQKDHSKIAALADSVNRVISTPSPVEKFKKLKNFKPLQMPVNKK